MNGKHIVGIVGILVVGAIVVTLLILHPWRSDEDRRRDHWQHEQAQNAAQQAADQTAANPNEPINAQVNGQVNPPIVAPAQAPEVAVPVAPGAVDASGQALTVTFPTEDDVEVFEDNAWVPAHIERRDKDRVFVQYNHRGGPVTQWVGPQQVRSLHDRGTWLHR